MTAASRKTPVNSGAALAAAALDAGAAELTATGVELAVGGGVLALGVDELLLVDLPPEPPQPIINRLSNRGVTKVIFMINS